MEDNSDEMRPSKKSKADQARILVRDIDKVQQEINDTEQALTNLKDKKRTYESRLENLFT